MGRTGDSAHFGARAGDMDFDGALAVILGWIGREVTAVIHDHSSMGLVGTLHGTLSAPTEIDDAASDDEIIWLPIGPDDHAALVLDRPSFLGAFGNAAGLALRFGSVFVALHVDIDSATP